MTAARLAPFAPLLFVPLVAWSKDAAVVALFAGAIAALGIRDVRRALPSRRSPEWSLGALTLVWGLVSLAWAPPGGAVLWVQVALVVAAAVVMVHAIAALDDRVVSRLAVAAAGAVGALGLILAVERVSGGAVIGLHRAAEPTARLFDVLSAGLAFLCCLTFPAAMIVARQTRRVSAGAAFVLAVLLLAVSYNMDAAPVAVVFGILAFTVVWWGGKRAVVAGLVVLAGIGLAWGVLAGVAQSRGADYWLEQTFSVNWSMRLGYWARVQELIAQSPIVGHGFGAGRVLGRPGAFDGLLPVPFMHPHNGVLEIWLDLGMIGVALIAAWAVARTRGWLAAASDRATLATAAATIATTSVFVLVSFSIWLGWWLSALGLIAAALTLIVRMAAARDRYNVTP